MHEIKKSDKKEEAYNRQVKYYLYMLEQNGIRATGLLEYPKLRKTQEVFLSVPDREFIEETKKDIGNVIHSETCPGRIPKPKCKNCSNFDFCYSNEV